MNKSDLILIVTTASGETSRLALADFLAQRPDLAAEAKRVLKTGNTMALDGLWLARGVACDA